MLEHITIFYSGFIESTIVCNKAPFPNFLFRDNKGDIGTKVWDVMEIDEIQQLLKLAFNFLGFTKCQSIRGRIDKVELRIRSIDC